MAATKIGLNQDENTKRPLGLDVDNSTEGLLQGMNSDNSGDLESESSTADSSSPQHPVGLPVDATPFVSFGEGADPVFKRIAIATHKYVYALNTPKLLGRLYDLPEENEYVPREMCYSPVTLSHDSDATPEFIPDDYPRLTEEELIENERLRKLAERPFPAYYIDHEGVLYKSSVVPSHQEAIAETPPNSRRSPRGQSPAQLPARRNSRRVSIASPPSQTKGSLHKTRGSRVEKNTRHNRNVTTGGSLSHQVVPIEESSPDSRPKRLKRPNAAEEPNKPCVEIPFKSNKAQKRLSKISRESPRARRLPKARQEPLRASRRLAGKQPEFDMLPYDGTALQKRVAPQRNDTNNVDLRSPSSPNRSPPNKKKAPSKAAKPQGIVKPETKSTGRTRKQKKRSGS
ncbi:hypothetical protein VE00_05827 [Pseudogymnoascus sp. WSF 3629]|nr:hypothetical protein VE00_05827 [Pseudogymnoascus sp. WSF 3629]